MPFDSSPTVTPTLARLIELQRVAEAATGIQKEWCSCLWHDARNDPMLRSMGLPHAESYAACWNIIWSVANFFGLDVDDMGRVFSAAPIAYKRNFLAAIVESRLAGRASS